MLEYCPMAESSSTHPIAKSLLRAYGRKVDRSRISDLHEISGHGVIAVIDGMRIAVGIEKLMVDQGV